MKISLSIEDLLQNKEQLSEFLNEKGMSLILGGQSSIDGTCDSDNSWGDVTTGPYSDKIYSNYSESTYVNRILRP